MGHLRSSEFAVLLAVTLPLAGCPLRTPDHMLTYGGRSSDWGHSVQATQDGGFVVAGTTSSFGVRETDMYLFRTDSQGKELWRRTYGGPRNDEAKSVQALEDGGFVLAGQYVWPMLEGREDVYLVRTDSEGKRLWAKTYGGAEWDTAGAVQVLGDGGFLIAGITASFGVQGTDGYVIRTADDGEELWTKTYGGADVEFIFSAEACGDSGFVFAGTTMSFGAGGFDAYLVRTDSEGNETWSKTYGTEEDDVALSVQALPSGGFMVAGWTASYGAAGIDGYLVRTDADGNELWRKTYGGPNDDMFSCVKALADGGYVAAGRYERDPNAGGDEAWLIRVDAAGNELRSRTYGGHGDEEAQSVLALPDGRFVLAGWTNSSGHGAWDAYLVMTDANGNELD